MLNKNMVSIFVAGEDKTSQISDWEIFWSKRFQNLQLVCHFPSKKKYTRPLSDCRISPARELGAMLLVKKKSVFAKAIDRVTIYGERYAVVYYPNSEKPYVYNMNDISFIEPTAMKDTAVFQYFVAVSNARASRAGKGQRPMMDNVVRQLDKLSCHKGTALYAYCTGENGTQASGQALIYPFGVNASQLSAVEQAFSAQISMIEGPPGTGKTQTILNILANILLRGKTVAVVSNNNSAVDNVYEKLGKCGLEYLVAKLGSQENRAAFFSRLPSLPSAELDPAPSMEGLQALLTQLKQHLHNHNNAAQLQADIEELRIEQRYLQQWLEDNGVTVDAALAKYGLSSSKTTDLMAYLSSLGEQRIRLKDRVSLFVNFRILRTKWLAPGEPRLAVYHALQKHYYEKTLREKESALQICQTSLVQADFDVLLEKLTTGSMHYLKRHLQEQTQTTDAFTEQTYKRAFDAFVRRFPVIGSSTHSIVNSVANGAILDYVIIDEASQQDIVPGILAMGCAQNLIIVGDNRQLPHIPSVLGVKAPVDAYDCERYSLLDSCIQVFQERLPRTLLKEHYRCHPRIIQFCNQQFYDNALLPMTHDNGENPLRLIVTGKGNHARNNTNLREIDSLLRVLDDGADLSAQHDPHRGYIAPFREQVNLSGQYLPAGFDKDTVHKFQGRECDEIVFSTVLDKKRYNQEKTRLDFVDDPCMVNVAVSRAKHRFTLVTGDDVFSGNNGSIAALIRYVEYYAQDKDIVRAPVVSAFDLLYREYDKSLEQLRLKLRAEDSPFESERIVAQLLREVISDESCRGLMYHTQIQLSQVAVLANPALTPEERRFMRNRASCDFVVYFKVGKVPLGVIEVDGGEHNTEKQAARDRLKNSILKKSNLEILRLRTNEIDVKDKLSQFVAKWTSRLPSA